MKAEYFAALTACCFALGSLLEKKGVHAGGLTPVMGTAIRTVFSLAILAAFSSPYWGELKGAGFKSFALIAVGGGLFAGALGLIFLYSGLKTGQLSNVLTIAFCLTPVVGAVLGYLVLNERFTPIQMVGFVLCVGGAAMVTYFKAPAV